MCIPKSTIVPRYEITSNKVYEYIQYMHEHVIICNCMHLWPSEKSLTGWINHKWKPKGHYDIKLGSNGIFTVILNHPDEYIATFEGGPYFFNVVGLYMRP